MKVNRVYRVELHAVRWLGNHAWVVGIVLATELVLIVFRLINE